MDLCELHHDHYPLIGFLLNNRWFKEVPETSSPGATQGGSRCRKQKNIQRCTDRLDAATFHFHTSSLGGLLVEFKTLSTQVQQQARCGACWSFAANGAVEGAWKVG